MFILPISSEFRKQCQVLMQITCSVEDQLIIVSNSIAVSAKLFIKFIANMYMPQDAMQDICLNPDILLTV